MNLIIKMGIKMSDRNYVYLLRCADNTMYCGWTTDLKARLAAHNNGKGAKYTRSRLPVELIWFEEFEDRHDALSREWHIKRMSREAKMALVESAFRQEKGAPGKSVVSKGDKE